MARLSILVVVLTLSLSFVGYRLVVNAQSVENLQDQRSVVQDKLNKLNAQIKAIQSDINVTRQQSASLKNEIKIYDAQIQSTQLSIEAKETQIEDVSLQIKEIEAQIARRKAELEKNKQILATLVAQLSQMGDSEWIQIFAGAGNFSDFYDQAQYVNKVNDKVTQLVRNIKSIKAKLESQQKELETQLAQLKQLKAGLEETKSALTQQSRAKQMLLTQTQGRERKYQALYSASKQEEANLEKEAEDLDQSIREKLGDRSISVARGALAMPMHGVITQKYGKTGFTKLGYTFHNGIDVAAPAGEPIYAAQAGQVIACDTGEASYGNWCAVKHKLETKNGTRQIITLYAHLRKFVVSKGQNVKMGDLIGYEGNTGNTTRLLYGPHRGYHLHFTIFDAEGFGIKEGAYTKVYGHYSVPYGYTYNPLDFVGNR
ncbi:MAG TPA: peptidoglycan DD-metalloendopeptidase family protein [Patescibacteria group bacterium]|nr:peptidoglycan DD-metalloendopeptidase family protein [Patescibacteria group bacterium]